MTAEGGERSLLLYLIADVLYRTHAGHEGKGQDFLEAVKRSTVSYFDFPNQIPNNGYYRSDMKVNINTVSVRIIG